MRTIRLSVILGLVSTLVLAVPFSAQAETSATPQTCQAGGWVVKSETTGLPVGCAYPKGHAKTVSLCGEAEGVTEYFDTQLPHGCMYISTIKPTKVSTKITQNGRTLRIAITPTTGLSKATARKTLIKVTVGKKVIKAKLNTKGVASVKLPKLTKATKAKVAFLGTSNLAKFTKSVRVKP
ncbi:MAG: hypothetical protein LBG70_02840 [Bifidobacteriaceae bacterium]|jgi:hypothetical protein|nr:hypothetical protein [Bifidobacteriaceae bacterium]